MLKHTILDAGCWRGAVLLGVDRATGLRTWIRSLYSLFELTGTVTTDGSVGDNQVYREADEFTISFLLNGPKAGAQALVNSCAEYAPSVVFPTREYDTDWLRTGTWSARAYALDQGPRRHVSAGRAFTLRPTGGADITAVSTVVAASGYVFKDHRLAVDNNEVPTDYELVVNGVLWANMTPWHGNRSVLGRSDGSGGVSYDVDRIARHVVAYAEAASGTIWLGVAPSYDLSTITFADTGIEAEQCFVRWVRAGQHVLHLYTVESGAVKKRVSFDEGANFGSPISVGSGTQVVAVLTPQGTEAVYYVDGSAIKGIIYDAQGNTLQSVFTAVASGVDDSQIGAQGWHHRDGTFRTVLWYSASSVITRVESVDGVNFS